MSKKKDVDNFKEAIQLSEPDERGWSLVLSRGKFYEKTTIIHDNGTTHVYLPIPFKKKENNQKK